ncbi:MAG TPA: thiamine pyrophosphate-dependent enzyme [Armatimonadota bacterium]|nr:thiamine pyrophosphate-dependent enzyme [Armatimonadota bacterium]
MGKTTGDAVIERLIEWGVKHIFGLPGDGCNGLFEALRKNQDKIQFIQVRHEEGAAFAACAYAKFTGKLGVCIATSGPGAIHLLNGLYDAKMDSQPVLALTGQALHDLLGQRYQQEVNLTMLYSDVAAYNETILTGHQAEALIDLACRTALSRKTVSHITIPADIQEADVKEGGKSQKFVKGHTSDAWIPPVRIPPKEDLQKAADVINSGKKTVILAGQGALGAREELEQLAQLVGGPIVKPLLGKATVPDGSPYTTGGIGLLGTLPSELAMEECDSLIMVGTSFPYLHFYPKPGKARAVQIDMDPTRLGLRYPVEIGLAGDSKATLQALMGLIKRRPDQSFLKQAQERMKDWWELMDERGRREDMPMKPEVVAYCLNDLLKDDAIVCTDSGTITTWIARQMIVRGNQMFSCSGNLATMAPGLPYAVGAQTAFPGRQVVAFVGDGGFTMLMGEFVTAVKYNLPIKVVIIKNNTLGQIKWEQMVFLGNPEFGVELQPIDFVKFAEACGGKGFFCDNPKEMRTTLDAALRHPGPCIVEAVVDANEPPMPAKVKPRQAVHMAEALLKGERHGAEIVKSIFGDKIRELV